MWKVESEKWNFLQKNRRPENSERRFSNGNCRIKELSRYVFPLSAKLFAHYLGNGVNDLVVAAAAACGTVGDALDLIEFLLNVLKFCHGMESVFHVGICYVHTITNYLVFHKKYNLSSGNFPLYKPPKNGGFADFIREYL